jgi:excisionase family DNA binding protein
VSNRKRTPSIPEIPSTPLISVAERRWLTLHESAAYLSFSPNRIRRFIHDGELPAARVGAIFRIERAALDTLMLRRNQIIAPYRKGTRPAVARRWAEYRAAKQTKQKRAAQ